MNEWIETRRQESRIGKDTRVRVGMEREGSRRGRGKKENGGMGKWVGIMGRKGEKMEEGKGRQSKRTG